MKLTEEALKERARAMLVAMSEEARWVYALERPQHPRVLAILAEDGAEQEEASAGAVRFAAKDGAFVVFDHAELDVVLLEGEGDGAVPSLRRILDATGFVPQSRLWREALDVGRPEALRALKILAHMAIGWDDDWSDLFLLYLASPDAIVRHEATLALIVAALVARETEPALQLLAEAQRREAFPRLKDTMREAEAVLRGAADQAVDVAAVEAHLPKGE